MFGLDGARRRRLAAGGAVLLVTRNELPGTSGHQDFKLVRLEKILDL